MRDRSASAIGPTFQEHLAQRRSAQQRCGAKSKFTIQTVEGHGTLDTPPYTILAAGADNALKDSTNAGIAVESIMRGTIGTVDHPLPGDPLIDDARVHTADPVNMEMEATHIMMNEGTLQPGMS